jgi:hypothetical protein
MNLEPIIEAVSNLNWQTVIGIFVVVWYFTKDVKKVNEDIFKELKSIHADLKTMNTRISRVEGTMYGKEIYGKVDKD